MIRVHSCSSKPYECLELNNFIERGRSDCGTSNMFKNHNVPGSVPPRGTLVGQVSSTIGVSLQKPCE